ncbi:mCG132285, partial [Mus musculus]
MADVGLICVDLSAQDLAVELLTPKSTCLWVLVGRALLAFPQTCL